MKLKRLPLVAVSNLCDVTWDAMTGTNAVRDCARCNRAVHNLSAMTSDEAEQLLQGSDGRRICITYQRGPDGELVTRDRPARFAFAAAAVVTLAMSGTAAAQTASEQPARSATAQPPRGGLQGTIQDPVREALPSVEIEARDVNSSGVFKTLSLANGTYELRVPRGRYDVSMNLAGFQRCVVEGVDVQDQVLVADANLSLATIGEVIFIDAISGAVGESRKDKCGNPELDKLRHKK